MIILPAHIIRLYIWELLKLNTNLAEVNGKIPIILFDDAPEMAEAYKDYIIYGYSENDYNGEPSIHRGFFNLNCKSYTGAQLNNILNTIKLDFDFEEANAEKLNIYSSSQQIKDIRFVYACVDSLGSISPPDTEGGTYEGMLTIEYQYITNQKVQSPVSGGLWSNLT